MKPNPSPTNLQREKKKRKLTAYLRFSGFERRMTMLEPMREIRIPVMMPLKVIPMMEMELPPFNTTPVLVFEYKKQLTKYTYEYSLKEIK